MNLTYDKGFKPDIKLNVSNNNDDIFKKIVISMKRKRKLQKNSDDKIKNKINLTDLHGQGQEFIQSVNSLYLYNHLKNKPIKKTSLPTLY